MKTIMSVKNNKEAENLVIIDLDSDNDSIINDQNVPLKTYVYVIDDDDDVSSVVNEREKIKEIDEYRRALEEDLSATQIALRVQAEEAQQLELLLKTKEAEKLRLLDMERTQKQRVEEIREALKKASENTSQPRVGKKRSGCVLGTEKKEKLPCSENTSHQKDMVSSQQDPSVETVDCSPCFGHRYDNSKETPTSNKLENEGKRSSTSSSSDGVPVESSIVNVSEKFNELECKLEENLSARHIALKVQAEEAQQLEHFLKTKESEKLRLLDMERRQKQRVEEIREAIKKAEEAQQLEHFLKTKEKQRVEEIREAIKKAEKAQQLERLLKTKEAEKLRLLDMERTQKQRVEEIREALKKASENTSQPRVGQKRSACVLGTEKKEKLPCSENTSHQKDMVSSQQDPSVETVEYDNSKETPTSNKLENEGKRISTSSSSDGVPVESSIVNESEKFNELECALEEKLSARHIALKAEEAKKVCLLNMEKRQKQHVEELRETQNKASKNTSKPRGRKKGSISKIKDESKNKQKLEIEFNRYGHPTGANKTKFATYVGVKTRTMISILEPTWTKVPQTDIDKLWLDIKEYWSIKDDKNIKQVLNKCKQAWSMFKWRLINYFLKTGEDPVPIYRPYLDESTWKQFVALKSTKEFQMERDAELAQGDWVRGAGVDVDRGVGTHLRGRDAADVYERDDVQE